MERGRGERKKRGDRQGKRTFDDLVLNRELDALEVLDAVLQLGLLTFLRNRWSTTKSARAPSKEPAN